MSLLNDIISTVNGYRSFKIESKQWIQFHVSLKLFPLETPIVTSSLTCKEGKLINSPTDNHKFVAEIVCRFINRGKIPFRLYNLQVWLSTIKIEADDGTPRDMFDSKTGRFKLRRIFTSGNLLDSMPGGFDHFRGGKYATLRILFKTIFCKVTKIFSRSKCDLPPQTVSREPAGGFYYIGPQIEQEISFLALLPEVKEIIQVNGRFSLEQRRIFPSRETGDMQLFPHTASSTYKIGANGFLIN